MWFYQLNLDRNLGKTNALNEKDLADFIELQKTKKEAKILGDNKEYPTTFTLVLRTPTKKKKLPYASRKKYWKK